MCSPVRPPSKLPRVQCAVHRQLLSNTLHKILPGAIKESRTYNFVGPREVFFNVYPEWKIKVFALSCRNTSLYLILNICEKPTKPQMGYLHTRQQSEGRWMLALYNTLLCAVWHRHCYDSFKKWRWPSLNLQEASKSCG